MSKVLVTGATGFTGSALCRRLVAENEQVVAFVRQTSDVSALKRLGVECRSVDLTSKSDVESNFEPFANVFHIAAAYRTEHADEQEFFRVNVEATDHLLASSRAHGVGRFVHCSTVGVQGEIEDPPATEEYRVKPGDHYQESKLEGEKLALRYFADGLPGMVVRPVGIYGPGDTRFLKLFRAISRGRFVMIGSGDVLYHLTFIDDLVEGFVLAAQPAAPVNETFTIAGPEYTTILELVNLIADTLDKPRPKLRVPFAPVYGASIVCEKVCKILRLSPPLYPRRVEFFQLDRAFSTKKAERLLGYRPQVPLRDGIRRTAEWYSDQGLL